MQDEISTGLDSSTTLQIVKCTRNFVQLLNVRVLFCRKFCVNGQYVRFVYDKLLMMERFEEV
jgi:hypothetical protein